MPQWHGEQKRRVSPHLLLAISPGHLAQEGYWQSRGHVNHTGRAGNVPG